MIGVVSFFTNFLELAVYFTMDGRVIDFGHGGAPLADVCLVDEIALIQERRDSQSRQRGMILRLCLQACHEIPKGGPLPHLVPVIVNSPFFSVECIRNCEGDCGLVVRHDR